MTNKLTPSVIVRTGAEYGIYACIAYIMYFILMRLIGMATVIELRFANYLFLLIAAYYASLKAENIKQWRLKYLQAFIVIFITGAFSFFYFSIFLLIYSRFDPIITNAFNAAFSGSESTGAFGVPFLIASEGIAISSIASLGMAFIVQEYTHYTRKLSGNLLTMNDQKS